MSAEIVPFRIERPTCAARGLFIAILAKATATRNEDGPA